MIQNRSTVALSAVAVALIGFAGCEKKTASSGSAGQGISGLAANPTSIPGKSASMGRAAAAGIQGQQDAAANAANQITGQAAGEMVVGGLKFAIPEGWKSVTPANPQMVKATYMIGGNAQVNFSTAGGNVSSNLERWRGQVTDASGQPVQGEVSEQSVGGTRITFYKATGAYADMSAGKKPNTAFRGAIIKAPAALVFVRLTGPADKIGPAEAAWEQVVMGLSQ